MFFRALPYSTQKSVKDCIAVITRCGSDCYTTVDIAMESSSCCRNDEDVVRKVNEFTNLKKIGPGNNLNTGVHRLTFSSGSLQNTILSLAVAVLTWKPEIVKK